MIIGISSDSARSTRNSWKYGTKHCRIRVIRAKSGATRITMKPTICDTNLHNFWRWIQSWPPRTRGMSSEALNLTKSSHFAWLTKSRSHMHNLELAKAFFNDFLECLAMSRTCTHKRTRDRNNLNQNELTHREKIEKNRPKCTHSFDPTWAHLVLALS